jgi:hypothetical protein
LPLLCVAACAGKKCCALLCCALLPAVLSYLVSRIQKLPHPFFTTWVPRCAFGAWLPVLAMPFLWPGETLRFLLPFQLVGAGLLVLDSWLPEVADAVADAMWHDSPLLLYFKLLREGGMLTGKAMLLTALRAVALLRLATACFTACLKATT